MGSRTRNPAPPEARRLLGKRLAFVLPESRRGSGYRQGRIVKVFPLVAGEPARIFVRLAGLRKGEKPTRAAGGYQGALCDVLPAFWKKTPACGVLVRGKIRPVASLIQA